MNQFNLDINSNSGVTISKIREDILIAHIYLKSILTGMVVGFINGFFGGGGGMICVPILTKIFKIEEKSAHATTIFIMLPLSIASFIIYMLNGNTMHSLTIPIIIGVVLGGVLGSMLLKKISNKILSIIFSIVIIYGGFRLLF